MVGRMNVCGCWGVSGALVSWAHTQVRANPWVRFYRTRLWVGADLRVCPARIRDFSSVGIFRYALERVMYSTPLIPQPLLPRKRGEGEQSPGRLAEAKRRKQDEGCRVLYTGRYRRQIMRALCQQQRGD